MRSRVALELVHCSMLNVACVLFWSRGKLSRRSAASMIHMSEEHFSREFHRDQGLTFRAAQVQAKIAHAVTLLSEGDDAIGDIADRLGYSEASKLRRAFRRITGISPSEYRQQHLDSSKQRTPVGISQAIDATGFDLECRLHLVVEIETPGFLTVMKELLLSAGRLSRTRAAVLACSKEVPFSRTFKRSLGVSFREMQFVLKVTLGACMLAYTDLRVSEISNLLCYATSTKFQRIFRHRFGIPPKPFRKRFIHLKPQDGRPFQLGNAKCTIKVVDAYTTVRSRQDRSGSSIKLERESMPLWRHAA